MASLVESIRTNLTNAYEKLEEKGVAISGYRNIENLAGNIDKINPQKVEQEKSVTIETNGTTEVTPDENKVLSKVIVTTDVQPTLQEKTVIPTTIQQTIVADSGNDGLSEVTVEAVTAKIDSNIAAENIKKDVTILGVTGTLEQGGAEAVLGTLNVTSNGTYEAGNALSLEPGGLYEYKKVLPREVLAELYVIQQSKSEGLLISIPDYTFPVVAVIMLKVDDEYVLVQAGMDGMIMSIYATSDVTFSIGAVTDISVTAGWNLRVYDDITASVDTTTIRLPQNISDVPASFVNILDKQFDMDNLFEMHADISSPITFSNFIGNYYKVTSFPVDINKKNIAPLSIANCSELTLSSSSSQEEIFNVASILLLRGMVTSSVLQTDIEGIKYIKDSAKISGHPLIYVEDASKVQVSSGVVETGYWYATLGNSPEQLNGSVWVQEKEFLDGYNKVIVSVSSEDMGDYTVKVIDYDGTVLLETKGNTGDIITLPTAPTHDKLVFQEWSASVAVANNTVTIEDNDVMVGAIYTTVSGKSEFDITLTKVTGLSVTLNMDGTKDWGDGISNTETTHTYTSYGDYTITCDGTTMTTSSSSGLFGQSGSVKNYYCVRARLVNVTSINSYAFYYCCSLISITIPGSVTSISDYAFQYCYSLASIVIPNSLTNIGSYAFSNCISLTNIAISNNVTNIGSSTFNGCYSLMSIIIPNNITSIEDSVFNQCYLLTNVTMPSNIASIKGNAFSQCYSLINITIPNNVTSIYSNAFYLCLSLTNITIPKGVTTIASYTFISCYSITKYDFSQHTSVPTLSNTNAFSNINGLCKIVVPDSLYDSWITATNWSTYADYIYKASEINGDIN